MKKIFLTATLAVFVCFAAVAHETKINPYTVTTNGIKDFGFQLFQALYEAKEKDPVALSPLSVTEAVTLAMHGANGDTLNELEGLLYPNQAKRKHFGIGRDTYTFGLGRLRDDLNNFSKVSDGAFIFNSANSLWANNNEGTQFEFTPQFLKTAGDQFGATLEKRDFADEKTVDEVNDWVATETKGKIKKLLSELKADDVAIILNAIYAKGNFKNHFDTVYPGQYTNEDGTTERVSFMKQKAEGLDFYQDDVVNVYSLKVEKKSAWKPEERNQIALDVIVPRNGKLGELVAKLNAGYYSKIVDGLRGKNIELTLPAGKVEQENAAKLKKLLIKKPFSVVLPFSDSSADFKALGREINDRRIYIADILTKAFYEMTPFGFEAAAATAVVFARETAILVPTGFEKHVVKSASLHVIRHVPTGTPLFIIEYDSPKIYNESELIDLVVEGHKHSNRLQAEVEDGTLMVVYDRRSGKQILAVVDKENDWKIVRRIEKELE